MKCSFRNLVFTIQSIKSLQYLWISLFALVCVGCSPRAVPTGYLESYKSFDLTDKRNLKMRQGPAYEAFLSAQSLDSSETSDSLLLASPTDVGDMSQNQSDIGDAETRKWVFVIQTPHWESGNNVVEDPEDQEKLTRFIRDRLYTWVGRTYPAPTLIRYGMLPDDPLRKKADLIFVESAVTDCKKGWGLGRYLIGYGLGSVSLQIEGRLRAGAPNGPLLGEYVARVRHNGFPKNGLNPKALSWRYCLQHAANEAALQLLPQIKTHLPGPPTAPTL